MTGPVALAVLAALFGVNVAIAVTETGLLQGWAAGVAAFMLYVRIGIGEIR